MSAAFPTPCIEFAPPLAHCRAMNTSWKTILPAALGAAWLGMAADARENPATGGRPLTILVLDYAGVADSSLDEMETLSTVLLARAGLGPNGFTASGMDRDRGRRCATPTWTRDWCCCASK
jgi:hypothetical protein